LQPLLPPLPLLPRASYQSPQPHRPHRRRLCACGVTVAFLSVKCAAMRRGSTLLWRKCGVGGHRMRAQKRGVSIPQCRRLLGRLLLLQHPLLQPVHLPPLLPLLLPLQLPPLLSLLPLLIGRCRRVIRSVTRSVIRSHHHPERIEAPHRRRRRRRRPRVGERRRVGRARRGRRRRTRVAQAEVRGRHVVERLLHSLIHPSQHVKPPRVHLQIAHRAVRVAYNESALMRESTVIGSMRACDSFEQNTQTHAKKNKRTCIK